MSYDVYISKRDRLFIAEVPAFPGCRTLGRTEAEALDNIRDVIESFLSGLRRHRRPYPRVKVIRISSKQFSRSVPTTQ